MKPEKYPRAVAARMVARESAEKFAEKALAVEAVLERVTKAAGDGFCTCRVEFARAIELRETEAAKRLAKVLTAQGFELEWSPRLVAAKDNPSGADVRTYDLLVRW